MTRNTPLPETVTVHVPFRAVKRGGRKEMQVPDGVAQPRKPDSALVKALARAFRWKRMLDDGLFTSITEIAENEKLSFTYISRVLRLSTLAPDLVEEIIDGKQPRSLMLAELLDGVPPSWTEQRSRWSSISKRTSELAE
jgi:hypothetical protein